MIDGSNIMHGILNLYAFVSPLPSGWMYMSICVASKAVPCQECIIVTGLTISICVKFRRLTLQQIPETLIFH